MSLCTNCHFQPDWENKTNHQGYKKGICKLDGEKLKFDPNKKEVLHDDILECVVTMCHSAKPVRTIYNSPESYIRIPW